MPPSSHRNYLRPSETRVRGREKRDARKIVEISKWERPFWKCEKRWARNFRSVHLSAWYCSSLSETCSKQTGFQPPFDVKVHLCPPDLLSSAMFKTSEWWLTFSHGKCTAVMTTWFYVKKIEHQWTGTAHNSLFYSKKIFFYWRISCFDWFTSFEDLSAVGLLAWNLSRMTGAHVMLEKKTFAPSRKDFGRRAHSQQLESSKYL